MALLIVIEAGHSYQGSTSTLKQGEKNRELEKLSWSINHEPRGGISNPRNTKGWVVTIFL